MRVAAAGIRLLRDSGEGIPTLVLTFALFHDSMRLHDGGDSQHGVRAAAFLRSVPQELIRIPADGMDVVTSALEQHSGAKTSSEPSTAICWDADRVNLWRLGIEPHPQYLSTRSALEIRLGWAKALQDQEFTWNELHCEFQEEEIGRRARVSL